MALLAGAGVAMVREHGGGRCCLAIMAALFAGAGVAMAREHGGGR
jgi:hypothetical protein